MSGPTPSIQGAWDGPGFLGVPDDALFLRWNNATSRFVMASAGVSDHGALTGLGDDDHAQYLLINGSRAMTGAVLLPDGTVGAPGLAFASDANLGLYRSAADTVVVVADGVARFKIQTGGAVSVVAGSTFSVAGGPATFIAGAATQLPIMARGAAAQSANLQEWQSSAGVVVAKVSAAGSTFTIGNGTGALYSGNGYLLLRSQGALQNMYFDAGGSFLFRDTVGDAVRATLGAATGNWTMTGAVSLPDGAVGTPALTFTADLNNGLYYISADSWGLSANSTLRIQLNATGIGFFGVPPVVRPTALTGADASVVDGTYGAEEAAVIANMRTRIGELETKLQALGLLT